MDNRVLVIDLIVRIRIDNDSDFAVWRLQSTWLIVVGAVAGWILRGGAG